METRMPRYGAEPTQASEKSGASILDNYTIDELLKLSDADFQKLYDELTGIQWGKVEDKFGWVEFVCRG